MAMSPKRPPITTLSAQKHKFTKNYVRRGNGPHGTRTFHSIDYNEMYVNRNEEYIQMRYGMIDWNDPYEDY